MISSPRLHRPAAAAALGAFFLLGSWVGAAAAADAFAELDEAASAGEPIYRRLCASCHGAAGEGVKGEYSRPLAGDKSLAELERFIVKSMPEDEPEKCVGEDAAKVARFVYEAFYSPIAQARNRPPRIELARLTVRQYRNAAADLIAGFRAPAPLGEERGLRAEFYNSDRARGRPELERLDPQVRLRFGGSKPAADKLDPQGFTIRWQGSVIAPDTGGYEFIIRTDHAARLWINDLDEPLIDAWVKSGSDTEYRGAIHLSGGRAYPLRLDFTCRQQGVRDQQKKRPEPVEGFIELVWKPPERAAETIPQRRLSPVEAPEVFVLEAPFPPDDRSVGYERGTSISRAWDEAATAAAIEAAGYIAAHLDELSGARASGSDRADKVREFCGRLLERAFRRPLTDEQRRLYVDRQFAEAADLETAVKRVALLALKSPRFLYLEFAGEPDAYAAASRLSFALWDSLPDAELLDAAAAGRLASRDEILRQAERMVADPRARAKMRQFLLQWLDIEHVPDLAKDEKDFLGFDQALISDLRTSLELFLDDVIWGEDSDFRQLLLSNDLYLNGRAARFYGFDLDPDAPFQKIREEKPVRAGVLSHPYLMARFAYTDASSPIHRGVFLARSVLGKALRPPPEAFTPLAPDLHPELTTRERVALQTEPAPCQPCHRMINPLGFSLEHFDAAGRFREEEKGKPIEAAGSYELPSGEVRIFRGARELAEFLAGSEEVHRAFVLQLFHYLVKQPIYAYGPETPERLRRLFAADGFDARRLIAEIAAMAAAGGPTPLDPSAPAGYNEPQKKPARRQRF